MDETQEKRVVRGLSYRGTRREADDSSAETGLPQPTAVDEVTELGKLHFPRGEALKALVDGVKWVPVTRSKHFMLDWVKAAKNLIRIADSRDKSVVIPRSEQKELKLELCRDFLEAISGEHNRNTKIKVYQIESGTIRGKEEEMGGFLKVQVSRRVHKLPADFYEMFRTAVSDIYPPSRTTKYQ